MRKIVVSMFMALDGVVEAPNQWSFQFGSAEQQKYKFDELFACDTLLWGEQPTRGLQPPGQTCLAQEIMV
jgi:hypothetical protein